MLSFFSEDIEEYVRSHATDEADIFAALARETREKMKLPQMMVGNVEGTLLRLMTTMTGARRALEIGTFTGYSALSIAQGLPADGLLITCDIDKEATDIARKYWDMSEHGGKITLKLGPAIETLATLDGEFDLVFIDADKEGYVEYWEACVPLVRKGGVLMADNVLWSGDVLDPQDDEARGIVAFNQKVKNDPRVEHVMLSVRDGIMLATRI